MTPEQAAKLAATILAAWPGRRENLTAAIYIKHLLPLDHTRATTAVDELVTSSQFLPPVADVLEAERRVRERERQARPALREPDLTDEQMAENVKRANELLRKIGRPARAGLANDQ